MASASNEARLDSKGGVEGGDKARRVRPGSTRVRRVTRAYKRRASFLVLFSSNHHHLVILFSLLFAFVRRLLCGSFVFCMDGLGLIPHALMPGDMAHNAFVRLTCDVEERPAWSTLDRSCTPYTPP